MTAIVKLFLKKPDHAQAIVQRVLQTATKDSDNPDVRDKAYVYWRLLSTDPAAAKVRFPPIHIFRTPLNSLRAPSGCRAICETTDILAKHYGCSCGIGRIIGRDFVTSQCLPQAGCHVYRQGKIRCRRDVEAQSRVSYRAQSTVNDQADLPCVASKTQTLPHKRLSRP